MTALDELPESDLKVETCNPHPPGGQHVGRGPCGVKITHLPSGLIAICDTGYSPHRNKAIAMDMIMGGLTSQRFP